MKVYKFGGASVKDADGIKNLGKIVQKELSELVIVVSAFGKTTNALEIVLKLWLSRDKDYKRKLEEVYENHKAVINELFEDPSTVRKKSDKLFSELENFLSEERHISLDADYDQVVSYGELWSTAIVAEYLNFYVTPVVWIDIRNVLRTDSRFRDANILWKESTSKAGTVFNFKRDRIYLTQGFIGGTDSGMTTTLGREGSDYTAAILANMLDAERVVVWKDVPGLLNADPKWFEGAEKMEEVSYREAVEMTFSGAKVIHPKTIKPLHNKGIPLQVRSFIDTNDTGTIVKSDPAIKQVRPVYVRKEDQILISILPRDFSFVIGDNLGRIFNSFYTNGIKVNLVEASAVSLDVCVDDDRPKVEAFIKENKSHFTAIYNQDVELLSIRHYTPGAIARIITGREILVEQRTRNSVRFVVRKAQGLNGSAAQR